MECSDNLDKLFEALATFRSQVQQPIKSADNPFFKSKYVDLDGVVKSVDEGLKNTGLSFTQEPVSNPGDKSVSVYTIITHKSGQYMKLGPLTLPTDKQNPQGFGSAETYARRYSLSAAFGITSDVDDDGNAASNSQKQVRKPNEPSVSKDLQKKINDAATAICTLSNNRTNEYFKSVLADAQKAGGYANLKTATQVQANRAYEYLKALYKQIQHDQGIDQAKQQAEQQSQVNWGQQ